MRPTPGRDEDPYERAIRDHVYRERVADAYEGRHDVMDALWWMSNDAEDSPSGKEAPGANTVELQRSVYSADAESSDIGAQERLQQLLADLACDREAIRAAVQAAGQQAGGDIRAEPDDSISVHATAAQGIEDHRGDRNRPRSRWRTSVAIVLVLAMGFGFGHVAAGIDHSADQPATTSLTHPALAAALSIFQIKQDDDDVLGALDPAVFSPESTRLMLVSDNYKVFAARRLSSEVCVVVMLASSSGYVSSCSMASEFPLAGLQVGWSGTSGKIYTSDGVLDTNGVPSSMVATWTSDGRVTMGSAISRN